MRGCGTSGCRGRLRGPEGCAKCISANVGNHRRLHADRLGRQGRQAFFVDALGDHMPLAAAARVHVIFMSGGGSGEPRVRRPALFPLRAASCNVLRRCLARATGERLHQSPETLGRELTTGTREEFHFAVSRAAGKRLRGDKFVQSQGTTAFKSQILLPWPSRG